MLFRAGAIYRSFVLGVLVMSGACDQPRSATSGAVDDVKPAPMPVKAGESRPIVDVSQSVPHPPTAHGGAAVPSRPAGEDGTLNLAGIAMTVPDGWIGVPVQPGPMAPKAVFSLPHAEGSTEDGAVRITHFPNMKGPEMDQRNIERWIGQVQRPDGSPSTREDARIHTESVGAVALTTVELAGAVRATMRSAPIPDRRMIAAIVDHPKGPHFVVVTADEATMNRWGESVRQFLRSARVR